MSRMTVVEALWSLGGVAWWLQLCQVVTRHALARAVRNGLVVRQRHGLYCLPDRLRGLHARELWGTVSHVSAAEVWELGVLEPPTSLHVTVRRHRGRVDRPAGVTVHYADLPAGDVRGQLTSVLRTVLDCARSCTFPQALAIADTALRVGHITRQELVMAAVALRGPGSARARRVARFADARAMSPLESALRGILIEGGITWFQPQYRVRVRGRWIATVDLCDLRTMIVLEADSFLWHGQRAALERDCRRYNDLVVAGYVVLRFAWEQVLGDPAWVLATVKAVLARCERPAVQQEQRLAA
jgi:very-short-patch-repair endonuclease